jgi:hypothetical protein
MLIIDKNLKVGTKDGLGLGRGGCFKDVSRGAKDAWGSGFIY